MLKVAFGLSVTLAVVAVLSVSGCSSDPSDEEGPDEDSCGREVCSDFKIECGTTVDGCGETVDCGLCRYSKEEVAPSGDAPALHAGATLQVAYWKEFPYEIRVARRESNGTWTSELVAAQSSGPNDPSLDFAVAADGKRWLAVPTSDNTLRIYSAPEGGSWTMDPSSPGKAKTVTLALRSNGEPTIAFSGQYNNASGIWLGERSGGTWNVVKVADSLAPTALPTVGLALRNDEPAVAWRDVTTAAVEVKYSIRSNGAFSAPQVLSSVASPVSDHRGLELTYDREGRLNAFYAEGLTAQIHAVQTQDGWNKSSISSTFSGRDEAFAFDGEGKLHVAFFNAFALNVADREGTLWFQQTLSGECDEGVVDMAADSSGGWSAVYSCGGKIYAMSRVGRYPEEFPVVCQELVGEICGQACSCAQGHSSDCCTFYSSGTSSGSTCSNSFGCPGNTQARVCGDPSVDPELIYACLDSIPQFTCYNDPSDGDWGTRISAPCAQLYVRSR